MNEDKKNLQIAVKEVRGMYAEALRILVKAEEFSEVVAITNHMLSLRLLITVYNEKIEEMRLTESF